MKFDQIDDVELISIKTKSSQDLDNDINFNADLNTTRSKELNVENNCFTAKGFRSNQFYNNPDREEEEYLDGDDHYESSVRCVTINKSPNGACGFHLTRTKWDPYPWVCAVDDFTPAANSDVKVGDCVLEINGCDVLGLRITEIAKLVKSSQHQVTLLLWSSNCNSSCDEESLCAAPMPRSLQRLSLVVQAVLGLIECPVCLETITPPAMQCQNGHLLCVNCRIRAEKCPVCRDRYYPRPALIAEQIHSAITSAFNLCRNEDKVRQRIFGRHNRQRQMVKATLASVFQKQQPQQEQQQLQYRQIHTSLMSDTNTNNVGTTTTPTSTTTTINRTCDRKVTDKLLKYTRSGNNSRITCNTFLTKLLKSKAYSMENLTNGHNNSRTVTTNKIFNTCQTTITSTISQLELLDRQQQPQQQQQQQCSPKCVEKHRTLFKDFAREQPVTSTNQFGNLARNDAGNHQLYLLTHKPNPSARENDLSINSKLCCNSLSTDRDLTTSTQENITCLLELPTIFMPGSPAVCETPYATLPRAIRLKQMFYKEQNLCRNDVLYMQSERQQ